MAKNLNVSPDFLFVDAINNSFIMNDEMREWHDSFIIPKYVRSGVIAMAFLVPQNAFAELTHVKTFKKEQALKSFETKFFKSEADVELWFKSIAQTA